MKNCRKCKSEKLVKNGLLKGRQRYKCKDCGFNQSVEYVGYPEEFKIKVIQAYLEGLGIRALSRIFKIGIATVINWIKKFAKELPEIEKAESVQIVEMDEMYNWVKEKKTKFGYGLRFAVLQVGYLPMRWAIVEHKQEKDYGIK